MLKLSWRSLLITLIVGVALMGARPQALPTIQFTDVTASAGLGGDFFFSETGHSLGVVWADFNLDGWPDIFATNGFDFPDDGMVTVPHLYLNDQQGGFVNVDVLLPDLPNFDYAGARVADYDRDGDPDIYLYTAHETWDTISLTNPPDGPPNLLLKNLFVENGGNVSTPLFVDVAVSAGVDDCPSVPLGPDYGCYQTRTAAFLDFDLDGCIDLYVGHNVMNQPGEIQNKDSLYHQRKEAGVCQGTFEDATDASQIQADPSIWRPTLGSLVADLNGDFLPDIYMGTASMNETLLPEDYNDTILLNNGDGTFRVWDDFPLDDTPAAMGFDISDVNGDGRFDIYITDFFHHDFVPHDDGNTLYLATETGWTDNVADGQFIAAGTSWGTHFFDADQDGDEDLFVGIARTPSQPPGHDFSELFVKDRFGGFSPLGFAAGLDTSAVRGSALADYDKDGDLDILVVNQNAGLQLFRNDTLESGNFLKVILQPSVSNRDSFGAVVGIEVGSYRQFRQVKGGSSAHSSDFNEIHFGLGANTVVDKVSVRWPSGLVSDVFDVPANTVLVIQE